MKLDDILFETDYDLDDWSDLDDLDDINATNPPPKDEFDLEDEELRKQYGNSKSKASSAQYVEKCDSCRGSGQFVSWSGRVVGPCFKCKGKGKLYFKTSPEQRAKARERTAVRKQRKLNAKAEKMAKWIEDNQEMYDFLVDNRSWNQFYNSMLEKLKDFGGLTPGQTAAVQKGIDKSKAKQDKRKSSAFEIDVQAVRDAFDRAIGAAAEKGNPTYKAKLHMLSKSQYEAYKADPENYKIKKGDLLISRAPDNGYNKGALYVKFRGQYVGKIMPDGLFYKAKGISSEALESVKELNSVDLLELAVAHGKATSICSCCGRFLENEISVELGIGPICRARWGL